MGSWLQNLESFYKYLKNFQKLPNFLQVLEKQLFFAYAFDFVANGLNIFDDKLLT